LDKQTLGDNVGFIPLTYKEFCDMGIDVTAEECIKELMSFSSDFNKKIYGRHKKTKAV
jgi:hypothetical protein